MGKAIASVFGGNNTGDNSALNEAQQRNMEFYNEGTKDYQAQQANRTAFGNQLADSALGKGPSIADAQMKAAQDRNLAQQLAAAKSNRSVNPALAFKQVSQMGAQGQQQIAQAAGVARLQEQQANQAQYQNYLNAIQAQRGQALGLNTQGASALSAANAQAAASQNQFAGNLISGLASAGASYATMAKKSGQPSTPEPITLASHGALIDGPEVVDGDSPKNDVVPAMLSAGEMVVPKSVTEQGPKEISKFAQQLLKSKQQENTKLTGPRASGYAAVVAAQADLHERLKHIESKFGKKK